MAKIRAYKIAEELGIDRAELVEKAASAGVELKSPMASLDDDEAAVLREKLGARGKGPVVEKRVERKGGAAVIRRRKKKVEAPPPEPQPPAAEEVAPSEPAPEPEPAAGEPEPAEPAVAEPSAPEPSAPEPQPSATAPEASRSAAPGKRSEQPTEKAQPPGKSKQRKRVREVVNLREQEQIARQVTSRVAPRRPVTVDTRAMQSPRRRRRDAPAPKPKPAAAAPKPQRRVVRVEGTITVADLARQLGAKAAEVQGKLMALGIMAGVNQAVDLETAGQVAGEFDFDVQNVAFDEEQFLAPTPEERAEAARESRPPVVTVMGHVDHGKTSLLDAIRKTDVVAGEAGGITQHIGAYQVKQGDTTLTFIDTPGHAAFTEMRARGAKVTDIVVLVVAANDGVMPQTAEAISHAKAAGVPIIVAINKVDLPDANSKRVRQRLMEHDLVTEDFGGDVLAVDVSATKGTGLDQLLEVIALQSEVLELTCDPKARAQGVVVEAQLDRGRGPVATILVQDGSLERGDIVVVGTHSGRVRAMQDENGKAVNRATPATPVQVIGLSGVPDAGELLHAVENERVAKQIIENREARERAKPVEQRPRLSLEELFAQAEGEGGVKELNVVLKADVSGSMEAVRDALLKLSTDEVKVNVIHAGVGAVSESDVMLARASGAIIVGFNVRPDPVARRAAESEGVDVRTYKVIYELSDEVKQAMAGLLPPTLKERFVGRAEVRDTFVVPKVGTIAGCLVAEGQVRRGAQCRLLRDGTIIHEGRIGSLKRFKDDVREVQAGFECGIGIEGYNDVKVGDMIEIFAIEEERATL